MVRSLLSSLLLGSVICIGAGCESAPPPPTPDQLKASVDAHSQRMEEEKAKYKNFKPKGHGR